MKALTFGVMIACGVVLAAQSVPIGPQSVPLPPEPASVLGTWSDDQLYAYENGLIEGAWVVAFQLMDQGRVSEAYQGLSVLSHYWWQISRPAGIRGAMAFVRAMYQRSPQRFTDMALIELVLMDTAKLERISR